MLRMRRKIKAQTLAEFAMILGTVLVAVSVALPIIRTAITGRIRQARDDGQWAQKNMAYSVATSTSTTNENEDTAAGEFKRTGVSSSVENESNYLGADFN